MPRVFGRGRVEDREELAHAGDERDLLRLASGQETAVERADCGRRWESLGATLPSTPVMDLTVQARERELVIGTYGRGAWILDLRPVRDRAAETTTTP